MYVCLYSVFCICAKFKLLSMIGTMPRTTLSSLVAWRTLMDPDWRHGGHGIDLMSNMCLIYICMYLIHRKGYRFLTV